MKVVICTTDSTKVLKASLSISKTIQNSRQFFWGWVFLLMLFKQTIWRKTLLFLTGKLNFLNKLLIEFTCKAKRGNYPPSAPTGYVNKAPTSWSKVFPQPSRCDVALVEDGGSARPVLFAWAKAVSRSPKSSPFLSLKRWRAARQS